MGEELDSTIRETAQSPAEVSIDGQTVKGQPIKDQIEADKYLATKAAAKKPGLAGVKFAKLVPPGSV